MNNIEQRATFTLASIFSFRMLGLFMILPIFSPYAHTLAGATPVLIGLAIGIYGLMQALFQLPLGALSDYFPRKNVIASGLVLFILGSIIAAYATTINGIIIGRALQGAGAIGSTIMALLADLTRDDQRSKAMAIIGMIIGLSFIVAMLLGPLLNSWIGIVGIFWLTAFLGLIGILFTYFVVPNPSSELKINKHQSVLPLLKKLLKNSELLRLDIGIFCLHVILTASFVIMPLFIHQLLKASEKPDWYIYAPVLSIAVLLTLPILGWAEKKQYMKQLLLSAICFLIIGLLLLWQYTYHLWMFGIGLTLFFTGFNLLEASLPALVSRIAPPSQKGAAIGIYSTCQFFGIFCGGILGGWIYSINPETVYPACAIIATLWLCYTFRMKQVLTHTAPPILS